MKAKKMAVNAEVVSRASARRASCVIAWASPPLEKNGARRRKGEPSKRGLERRYSWRAAVRKASPFLRTHALTHANSSSCDYRARIFRGSRVLAYQCEAFVNGASCAVFRRPLAPHGSLAFPLRFG